MHLIGLILSQMSLSETKSALSRKKKSFFILVVLLLPVSVPSPLSFFSPTNIPLAV